MLFYVAGGTSVPFISAPLYDFTQTGNLITGEKRITNYLHANLHVAFSIHMYFVLRTWCQIRDIRRSGSPSAKINRRAARFRQPCEKIRDGAKYKDGIDEANAGSSATG